MSAVPPSFTRTLDPDGLASPDRQAEAAGMRWAGLSDAAALVAALAGLEPERPSSEMRHFTVLIRAADPWRRERAEQGVADLAAIMEPGIAALVAVNARGADPRPAALALWREFAAAREAILALLPPVKA
jgi:hypothetical protein